MKDAARTILNDLQNHARQIGGVHLRDLFAADDRRFEHFSASLGDLTLDFSKNRISEATLAMLERLCAAAGLDDMRAALFGGEPINLTEGRSVLHTALRNRSGRPVSVGGADVMPEIKSVLERMGRFAEDVRAGRLSGSRGDRFTHIVNIGIGGSDLGPAMAVRALSPYRGGGPDVRFVSNVDGADIADTLQDLDPARTLFLVASKTFTTLETMTNAGSARAWIVDALGEDAVGAHFAAISTNLDAVAGFGIAAERTFGFWDWVGGRYSVWSAIGLPLAISISFENFTKFLAGAHRMDEHFRSAPFAENLPVLMAAIGIWNRNVLSMPSHGIMAYDQRLGRFAAHLQQLDMESNGKRVMRDGRTIDHATGPIVWGEPGTNGQHAFFQLLHQGTDIVPCDFLIAADPHEELTDHHEKLVANCLAQTEALAFGKTEDEVRSELAADGFSAEEIDALAPHRTFPGNRPTNTLIYRRLDPETPVRRPLHHAFEKASRAVLPGRLLQRVHVGDHAGVARRVGQQREGVRVRHEPDLPHRPESGPRRDGLRGREGLHRHGEPDALGHPALQAINVGGLAADDTGAVAVDESDELNVRVAGLLHDGFDVHRYVPPWSDAASGAGGSSANSASLVRRLQYPSIPISDSS